MTLPEIAARLREIAAETNNPELSSLADEMRRRPHTKAPVTSAPMTDELRDKIRGYALAHPLVPQHTIAQRFNVNHGRVSEALKGYRT